MSTITAAELKRRGVAALAPAAGEQGVALVTVRGKARYVVMTVERYDALRESELDRALAEARADYAAGRVLDRNVDDHMRRLEHDDL